MAKENFKIAQDIVASYETRLKVVQTIVGDTQRLLEEFRKRREKMNQELKTALAKHKSLRKKDFDKMMEGILIAQSQREDKVKAMLGDFQKQEMKVLASLRELLKKGERLRLNDFKKTLAKIKKQQESRQKETPSQINLELAQMRSEVHQMLENFKKARQKVASEWQTLTGLTAQKRKTSRK